MIIYQRSKNIPIEKQRRSIRRPAAQIYERSRRRRRHDLLRGYELFEKCERVPRRLHRGSTARTTV